MEMKKSIFLLLAAGITGSILSMKLESLYRVVIDKSDYSMTVYDGDGWLATYPVVFGNKNQGDKRMEGDRLTPNGRFRITFKKQGALRYTGHLDLHKLWERAARRAFDQGRVPPAFARASYRRRNCGADPGHPPPSL